MIFYHFAIQFVYHFTISLYQFVYNYTISLNSFSRHLTHHLYQCYILTDHLSNYSESDESIVDRLTPAYTKPECKYETYLHISPGSMDNFLNNNSSKTNFYARSKHSKEFGGYEAAISKNYFIAGRFCVDAFNYGYAESFRKK